MIQLKRVLTTIFIATFASFAQAQQNAGPLNAAPGVPNQSPTQPNIATRIAPPQKTKNQEPVSAATQACENLREGSPCEIKGINTAKRKGKCLFATKRDLSLSCMLR